MLDNSKNVLINGGTYISYTNLGGNGIDLLRQSIAPSAFHNSSERYDAPKCHPQTRLAVLEAIMEWTKDGQKESFIMWLYGPAGAGKSAILQTIAEMCHRMGIIAASFFWSRSAPARNDKTRLIASLAYQLIIAIPHMRIHVEQVLEVDPSLLSRSLEAQMQSLIVEPLEKTFVGQEGPANPGNPKLIILDGLDECGTPKTQQYILKVISEAVQQFPIPIVFLIASRPEHGIRDSFNTRPLLSITSRLALDDTFHPDDDIRLFLLDSFNSLRESHTLGSLLPHDWPTEEVVDSLVRKSSGQFIYAATVMKFVSSARRRPVEQLDIIFGIADTGSHTPFAELDALYCHIFNSVEDLPRALEVIGCLFLMSTLHEIQFTGLTTEIIETVLSYKRGDLHLILSDLHSVFDVPDITDVGGGELRVFHASLQDFLMDPNRSRNFFIDRGKAHARLAQCFLKHIHKDPGSTVIAIACQTLVKYCQESCPTPELLRDLFDFDFENWVSIFLTLRGPRGEQSKEMYIYKELVRLFTWLKKQESIVKEYLDTGISLHAHHSRPWNMAVNSVCTRMVEPHFDILVDRNEITAITHPSFLHLMAGDIHAMRMVFYYPSNIVDRINMQLDFFNAAAIPQDENRENLLELQQFLSDRDRAGTCFVHGGMYATLSLQIAKFLFDKSQTTSEDGVDVRKNDGIQERAIVWAFETLPFYLLNADYTLELAAYLLSHTLQPDASIPNRIILQDAIDLYLKKKPSKFAMKGKGMGKKLSESLKKITVPFRSSRPSHVPPDFC